MKKSKPQVIFKVEDEFGVHLVKKWPDQMLSIEGHTKQRAEQHNINAPDYFFPVDQDWVNEFIKKEQSVIAASPN